MNYRSFIKRDYKLRESADSLSAKLFKRRSLVIAGFTFFVGLVMLLSLDATSVSANISNQEDTQASSNMMVKQTLPLPEYDARKTENTPVQVPRSAPVTSSVVNAKPVASKQKTNSKRIKVRKGDTLAAIFSRNKLSARDVYNIIALGKPTRGLKNLKPGQIIQLNYDEQGDFNGLRHELNKFDSLQVLRDGSGYTAKSVSRKPEVRIAYASGKISNSLFLSAQKAGMEQSLIMELATIFGWDIDFALDIRQGDSFHVVYEEQYLDGEKIRHGNILAAEFTNRGRSYRAVRYTDKNNRADYYTPDGHNMRKAFLRTPVDFRRISSRFGMRHHPTLKKRRLHTGVDYAAKRGTPVRATGDGKIIHRGRKGGYGKTVIIRHGNKYSTLYAHLSNFNRKARGRVKQGQIIGYVGSTGRSTGPHLHYEFRVYGTHRNPLTIKLPSAASIASRYKQDFFNKTQGLLAQLDGLKRTDIALAQ